MKLPQKYLYKTEIIEEIAAYDYSRYGDYDLPDLFPSLSVWSTKRSGIY